MCRIPSDFDILICEHLFFKNYVYEKDIHLGKIYPDTEWSTQMLGTLQNVSSVVGFSVPEKGIRNRPLNANHTVASTHHV